jgi:hypothetical protein
MTTQPGGAIAGHMQQMLQTHPQRQSMFDAQALVACIQECFDCAQTCTACADACLSEPMVQQLAHCIRLNLDCADVCNATGRVLARQTQPDMAVVRAQLQSCLQACQSCGAECTKHAHHHQHCAVCADACHRCVDACNRLLSQAA